MRPDEGRKYPDPGPLIHSSTARTRVRIDAPEPVELGKSTAKRNPQMRSIVIHSEA